MKSIELARQEGLRMTRVRRKILEFLEDSKFPVSAPDIANEFSEVNKSSIYRELDTLFKKKIVQKVYLFDERESYELAHRKHHHHLRCEKCECISDVSSQKLEKALESFEGALEEETDFISISHHLEFEGVCKNCK